MGGRTSATVEYPCCRCWWSRWNRGGVAGVATTAATVVVVLAAVTTAIATITTAVAAMPAVVVLVSIVVAVARRARRRRGRRLWSGRHAVEVERCRSSNWTGGVQVDLLQEEIIPNFEEVRERRVASDDGSDMLEALIESSKDVEDEDPVVDRCP
jgi:hypothetical protein